MIRRDSAVVVFAKAPIAGRVKTRLIPAVSPGEAAALHAALVLQTLCTARSAGFDAIELWCWPRAEHPLFRFCQRRFRVALKTQHGQNLGARMAFALRDALKRHRSVILIGTDCPGLCADDLKKAGLSLDAGYRLVLGPCEDGGYFLIGLKRLIPELFRNIAWGRSDVAENTRLRLRRLGLHWAELPLRWDLDRPEDLSRLVLSRWGLRGEKLMNSAAAKRCSQ